MSIKILHNPKKDVPSKIYSGIKLAPITPSSQQKIRMGNINNLNKDNLNYHSNKVRKQNNYDLPIAQGIKKLKELKNLSRDGNSKSTEKLKVNRNSFSSNKIKMNNSKIQIVENHINNKSINYYNKENTSNPTINKYSEMLNEEKELLTQIISLWQELCVSEIYQKSFEDIAEQLDIANRHGYYEFEFNQLKKVKQILTRLIEEIKSREKAIELFSYFEMYLKKKENDKAVLENIISTIHNLRVLSINIVNHFIKFRKTCSYDILNGKYDLNSMQGNFKLDFNYLIKMKNDTDFLGNTSLKKIFNFSNESDPFFISVTSLTAGNNLNDDSLKSDLEKIRVPIEDNMLSSIKTCQYYIIQEIAYTEINRYGYDSSKYLSSASSYHRNLRSANNNSKNSTFNSNTNNVTYSNKLASSKSPNNRNFFLNTNKPRKLDKLDNSINYLSNKNANVPPRLSSGKSIDKLLSEQKLIVDKLANIRKMKKIKIHIQHEEKDSLNCDDFDNLENKLEKNDDLDKNKVVVEGKFKREIDDNTNIDLLNEQGIVDEGLNDKEEKIISIIQKIDDALQASQTFEKEEVLKINTETYDESQNNKIKNNIDSNDNLNKIEIDINKYTFKNPQTINIFNQEKDDKVQNNSKPIKIQDNPSSEYLIVNEADIQENLLIENIDFDILKGNIDMFQSTYTEYLAKLNEEQKIIFNISSELKNYLKGNFPKIIKFVYKHKAKNYLIGLAAINYDPQNENIKLVISSFSTIFYKSYDEIFQKFLIFIKKTWIIKEIYLELHYGNNNKININYITEIISKKNKFRWIALENTEEGRKTKYRQMNSEYVEESDKNKNDPRDIFTLVDNIVINVKERNKITEKFSELHNKSSDEYEICLFSVTCLLSDMIYNHDFESENGLMRNFKHNYLTKYQHLIKSVGSSPSEVYEFLNENFNVEYKSDLLSAVKEYLIDEDNVFSALMRINLRFDNVMTIIINNLVYNRLKTNQIDIMEHPDDHHQYYLIKTADPNFSVVLSEIEENSELKNLIENKSKQNLTALFFEIYSRLIQISANEKKNIFIPAFKLKQNRKLINPKSINEIEMQFEGDDYAIEKFLHYNEVNFLFDKSYLSKGEQNIETNFFTKDYISNEDIFIKKDFIISVINSDILTDLNIPIMSVSIIRQSDFIRIAD